VKTVNKTSTFKSMFLTNKKIAHKWNLFCYDNLRFFYFKTTLIVFYFKFLFLHSFTSMIAFVWKSDFEHCNTLILFFYKKKWVEYWCLISFLWVFVSSSSDFFPVALKILKMQNKGEKIMQKYLIDWLKCNQKIGLG